MMNTTTADGFNTVPGFSLTNRWLLYTSIMLAPAQFVSGIHSNCVSNVGFLAYNYYTQIMWYRFARAKQLHALSLIVPHFNTIYLVSYLGGLSSGSIAMALVLSLGTSGVILLNLAASWVSFTTNLAEGFGTYKFFFFGWRTLNSRWYKFFLAWEIFDTMGTVGCVISAFAIAISVAGFSEETGKEVDRIGWRAKYLTIPIGAAGMLCGCWPLILWTELIVQHNKIVSETDKVAIALFGAQVAAMLLPSCWMIRRRQYFIPR